MCSVKRENNNLVLTSNNIILDIEGTTTSITFVKDVLFPYVRKHLETYVKDNWDSESLQVIVSSLRVQAKEDLENKLDGVIDIPEDGEKDVLVKAVIQNVLWQMDLDRKTKSLKELQGLIMEIGYINGEIKGHVYEDVEPNLKSWTELGKTVYIYSSGSVHAQKLLYGHSEKGDLLQYIKGHFDTTVGMKGEAESYKKILEEVSGIPSETVFFTDVPKEAKAAKEVGLTAILLSREGNAPLTEEDKNEFQVITSFSEVHFENVLKKRKVCTENDGEKDNKSIELCTVSLKPLKESSQSSSIQQSDLSMEVEEITIENKESTSEKCDLPTNGNVNSEKSQLDESCPQIMIDVAPKVLPADPNEAEDKGSYKENVEDVANDNHLASEAKQINGSAPENTELNVTKIPEYAEKRQLKVDTEKSNEVESCTAKEVSNLASGPEKMDEGGKEQVTKVDIEDSKRKEKQSSQSDEKTQIEGESEESKSGANVEVQDNDKLASEGKEKINCTFEKNKLNVNKVSELDEKSQIEVGEAKSDIGANVNLKERTSIASEVEKMDDGTSESITLNEDQSSVLDKKTQGCAVKADSITNDNAQDDNNVNEAEKMDDGPTENITSNENQSSESDDKTHVEVDEMKPDKVSNSNAQDDGNIENKVEKIGEGIPKNMELNENQRSVSDVKTNTEDDAAKSDIIEDGAEKSANIENVDAQVDNNLALENEKMDDSPTENITSNENQSSKPDDKANIEVDTVNSDNAENAKAASEFEKMDDGTIEKAIEVVENQSSEPDSKTQTEVDSVKSDDLECNVDTEVKGVSPDSADSQNQLENIETNRQNGESKNDTNTSSQINTVKIVNGSDCQLNGNKETLNANDGLGQSGEKKEAIVNGKSIECGDGQALKNEIDENTENDVKKLEVPENTVITAVVEA